MIELSKKADYLMGLMFVACLALILGALSFQHFGGLTPCDLCYKQRWVYYIALVALPLGLLLFGRGELFATKILLFVLAAAFFANMVLGVYHAGVEWHFWLGPTGCTGGEQFDATIDLLEALKTVKPVACDVVQWRFLGISMAGYSAFASLGLAAIALFTSQVARVKD